MKDVSGPNSVGRLVEIARVGRKYRRSVLMQQASRLSLRSAVRATAMGFSLLAPAYAGAQCVVISTNVQCNTDTTTTDTSYPTNAPNDRGYSYNMPAPVTLTIDDGVQIDGYGLAIDNGSPTGGAAVVNRGLVIVDAGRTPTTQGSAALSITAAGPVFYNGSGTIINYGTGDALGIMQTGTGGIDVSATGNVSSASGAGINAQSSTGYIAIATGLGGISGGHGAGISAISGGTGPVLVTTGTGSVTTFDPVGYFGIDAESAGGDVTVSIGSGGVLQGGAYARSTGAGNVSLSTTGNINDSSSDGVDAIGEAGTVGVSLAAGTNVTGSTVGIYANSRSGKITVLAGDGSTITGGNEGVSAVSTLAGGDIKIAVANAIGGFNGIYAHGLGAIDVSASGNVSGGTAIDAESGGGAVSVTTGVGAISGSNGTGIKAISSGAQAVTVTTGAGSVTTLDPSDYLSLDAESAGGDVTVSIGSGGILQSGAYVRTTGAGNIALSTAGNINDTNAEGVDAIGDAGTVGVSLAAGTNVTGGNVGIYAASRSGKITVLAGDGSAITGGMYGISALSILAGGDIKIAVANATGATEGIYASGLGAIDVSASGNVSGGTAIDAESGGGAVSVTTGTGAISGSNGVGIKAVSTGAGAVTVTTGTGSVTTLDPVDFFGVDAESAGGDVTVSIGSGGVPQGGAYARTAGTGNVLLSTAGNISQGVFAIGETGTVGVSLAPGVNVTGSYTGVAASSSSGKITVLAGDGSTITGGRYGVTAASTLAGGDIKIAVANVITKTTGATGGIYASGAGAIDVSASGIVKGGTGIDAEGTAGPITVTTGAGAITGGSGPGVKAINASSGAVTVTTGTGSVTTLDPVDYVGLDAESAGGDVTVSIGSGGIHQGGAYARSAGPGNVSLSTAGNISQSVFAIGEAGTVGVSLAPGTSVTGSYTGVGASSTSGKITVLAGDGSTISGGRYGVTASTLTGGDIKIAVANVITSTTGATGGIYATGAGAIDVSASGIVKGGTGIDAEGTVGPITVTTGAGAITGGSGPGIKAINASGGAVTVTTGAGSVTTLDPADYYALDAESAGGDVKVSVGSGGVLQGGAYARTNGTGNVSLSTAGNISNGVFAIGDAGTVGVSLAPGTSVTGSSAGIYAASSSGKITVSAGDGSTITGGIYGSTITGGIYGVSALSTLAGGDIKIAVAGATGATDGIYANGIGAIDIGATGIVTGGNGIDAKGTAGPITVTTGAGSVTGATYAIQANDTMGAVTVTTGAGAISGINSSGILAVSNGNGAVTVMTGAGSVTTLDPHFNNAVAAFSRNGDVTITIGSGGIRDGGAAAFTGGAGSATLAAAGNIGNTMGVGLQVVTDAGAASASLGNGATLTATDDGIDASAVSGSASVGTGIGSSVNSGGDGISVIARSVGGTASVGALGSVTSTGGFGISATTIGGTVDVTTGAGAISGGNGSGIQAISNGNDAVTVTTGTGSVTTLDPVDDFGLVAQSAGGNVTVAIGSGGILDGGAYAQSAGAGTVSLSTAGNISASTAKGVVAIGEAGTVGVSLAPGTSVTGNSVGVAASSTSGKITVSAGYGSTIAGGTYGVAAQSTLAGGDINVAIANAFGATDGVYSRGVGAIDISATGNVSGGSGIVASNIGGVATNGPINVSLGAAGKVIATNGSGIVTDSGLGIGATTIMVGGEVTANTAGAAGVFANSTNGAVTVQVAATGKIDPTFGVAMNTVNGALEVDNAGLIAGTVTGVQLVATGAGTGSVNNSGTISGGASAVVGQLAGGSFRIDNSGTLNGAVNVAGANMATSSFTNEGTGVANLGGGASSFAGAVINSGTVNITPGGSLAILGNATNTGIINLANNATNNALTVGGNYTGGGQVRIDYNTQTATADRFTIAGTASGTTLVVLNPVGQRSFAAGGFIPVVTVAGGAPAGTFYGAGISSGLVLDSVGPNPANATQFGVVQTINPQASALGALTYLAESASGLLDDPIAPFVTNKTDAGGKRFSLWARGSGGHTTQTIDSVMSGGGVVAADTRRVRDDHHAIQFGADLAFVDIGNAWNVNVGVMGGWYGADAPLAGGGTIKVDAPFAGGYLAIGNGAFTLEGNVRKEWRHYCIGIPSIFGTAALAKTHGNATAESIKVSYRVGAATGFAATPFAALDIADARIDPLQVDAITTYTPGGDKTAIGQGGVRLSYRTGDPAKIALEPFASAARLENWSRGDSSTFAFGTPITNFSLQTSTWHDAMRYSAGLNGTAKGGRVSAFVVGDLDDGSRLKSFTVNAGVRFNF